MTRPTITRLTALLAAVALGACHEETPPPPPPGVSATQSSLTAAPGQVTADGVAAATLIAVARDAAGAPLQGRIAVFAVTGTANQLSAAQATTGANGVAAVSVASTTAEVKVATVTIDGVAVAAAPSLTFLAGAPARLAFTTSPAGGVSGEPVAPAAVVRIEDQFGNPITSGLDTISLALQGGNPAAVLGGTTSAGAVLGEATFANLTVDLVGSYTLAASATGLTGSTSSAFQIAAAAAEPVNSGVAAAAPTQTAGAPIVLVATVRDVFGNPVEGASVTFATTAAGATFVQPPATGASGEASGSVSSTIAGALTVTASIGGGPSFAGTADVTFEVGAPSATTSTLVATPASVEANGIALISLVVTVEDEFGNAVPGAGVTLSSTNTASFVQPGPTDANGVATGAVRSTVEGAQVVTASVGGAAVATADVTFSTIDIDGDGIPNAEDTFPNDPNRFANYATVALPGLGGTFATAVAISPTNVVVGLSEDGGGLLTGARWTVTGTTASLGAALSPLPGNAYSAAYAVDVFGSIVGESARGAEYVAVLWAPGAVTPTALRLGGFTSPSAAYGVFGSRIVGEAGQGTGSAAVLWAGVNATPVPLASLGGDRTAAYAIAGSFVVGESNLTAGGESRGVVWTLDTTSNAGAPIPLAPLTGHVSSIALGVDAAGRIVGESESSTGVVHAVSWTVAAPGAPTLLGTGSAQGVNASGRVAGHGGLPAGPLLWDVRNPAIPEGVLSDPFQFSQAYGLNGANVVVGLLDGGAFAAVPVPVTP